MINDEKIITINRDDFTHKVFKDLKKKARRFSEVEFDLIYEDEDRVLKWRDDYPTFRAMLIYTNGPGNIYDKRKMWIFTTIVEPQFSRPESKLFKKEWFNDQGPDYVEIADILDDAFEDAAAYKEEQEQE